MKSLLLLMRFALALLLLAANSSPALEVGFATRDVTPELPIRMAGYASRSKPADKVEHPLLVQAMALKNPGGERFVFVALDNCEVSAAFNAPMLKQFQEKYGLNPGEVMIVSSHTHSAPILEQTLVPMYNLPEAEEQQVKKYSAFLRAKIVEVVGAALLNCRPALLEHAVGRATFAMNRRVYRGDRVNFGENPDAPVDWDVPVLKVMDPKPTNDIPRAILFGYTCHATSIAGGEGFYTVTGEYMAYARQHIEAVYPGVTAMFLTGMGADSNPSPRGHILESKRHGLELAGAVAGILSRPMRPVRGDFKFAYDEVELPFVGAPTAEQLDKDAQDKDLYIRQRANLYKKLLSDGKPLPTSIKLPVAALRIGNDLTFVAMAGEVVVDFSRQFKRMLAADHPWTIGYAYEVPCYIPSVRILKEGGYEADSSLIYYGFYGPFKMDVEHLLVNRISEMVRTLRPTQVSTK
jgi:neutral ceramidase